MVHNSISFKVRNNGLFVASHDVQDLISRYHNINRYIFFIFTETAHATLDYMQHK